MYAVGTCGGHGSCGKKSCSPSSTGTHKEAPTMSDVRTITRDELAALIKAGNVSIFDARGSEQFSAGHIDGAVLYSGATLPADKAATIVFYCAGVKCPVSTKAAKKALEAGYTNVMVYRGGWAEWSANS
jgi:rhodanese-related sulfurtransferase